MEEDQKFGIKKILKPVVILLAIVTFALIFLKSQTKVQTQDGVKVELALGAEVPNLNFVTLKGEQKSLNELKGKVTLINFWATWCEACMEEMPTIVAVHENFKDKGFQVIGVNLDDKPENAIPKTEQSFNMKFPSFPDKDGKLSSLFDVHAVPLTVVVDENLKVIDYVTGDRDWMEQEFQDLLAKQLGN